MVLTYCHYKCKINKTNSSLKQICPKFLITLYRVIVLAMEDLEKFIELKQRIEVKFLQWKSFQKQESSKIRKYSMQFKSSSFLQTFAATLSSKLTLHSKTTRIYICLCPICKVGTYVSTFLSNVKLHKSTYLRRLGNSWSLAFYVLLRIFTMLA